MSTDIIYNSLVEFKYLCFICSEHFPKSMKVEVLYLLRFSLKSNPFLYIVNVTPGLVFITITSFNIKLSKLSNINKKSSKQVFPKILVFSNFSTHVFKFLLI